MTVSLFFMPVYDEEGSQSCGLMITCLGVLIEK